LSESRNFFMADFAALPAKFKTLRNPAHYPVEHSHALDELREQTTRKYAMS